MLLRRGANRRSGFTLIELLVVIAIIAIIMSLLLVSVMNLLGVVGPKADTTARIAAINNAIGTFKANQSFGQVTYIPPGRLENGQWLPFRLQNSYSDPTCFEAQYLQKVFGGGRKLNWLDLGMGSPTWGAQLDANQTLTFFLTGIPQVSGGQAVFTGFSTDPMQPFKPRALPDETRRGPVLDLGGKPKYVMDPNGFARLVDGFGTPFIYFASYNGQANKYFNGGYNPIAAVAPYQRGGQAENASGFQIISAGKDLTFGPGGLWIASPPQAGKDDQGNFSNSLLGNGPQ